MARLGFSRFLLAHCSIYDACRILWEVRFGGKRKGTLGFSFQSHGRKLRIELRKGTTDFAVFFEVFYAQVYPIEGLKNPDVVVDLGANIGMASLYFTLHFPKARVIGFEPVPENAEIARRHLTDNGLSHAVIHAMGVSDSAGKKRMTTSSEGGFGDFTLVENGSEQGTVAEFLDAQDLFSFLQIEKVDLLKIDVEGAEHLILPKLGNNLEQIKLLVGEMHGSGVQVQQTLTWLERTHDVVSETRGEGECFHFQAKRKAATAS